MAFHILVLLGGLTAIIAIVAFVIYQYRNKQNMPILSIERKIWDRGYPDACPCGCGLQWDEDTPPHYGTPPVIYPKNQTHWDFPQQCKHKKQFDGIPCTCGHPHNYSS